MRLVSKIVKKIYTKKFYCASVRPKAENIFFSLHIPIYFKKIITWSIFVHLLLESSWKVRDISKNSLHIHQNKKSTWENVFLTKIVMIPLVQRHYFLKFFVRFIYNLYKSNDISHHDLLLPNLWMSMFPNLKKIIKLVNLGPILFVKNEFLDHKNP